MPDAIAAADNSDLIVVEASAGAAPITNLDEEEIAEHGQFDPHLWLSLQGAQLEALNIKNALVEADPAYADYYEANYADFASQLNTLFTEYQTKFSSVSRNHFVTGHAAFGYLCQDFGLAQNSVKMFLPRVSPAHSSLWNW